MATRIPIILEVQDDVTGAVKKVKASVIEEFNQIETATKKSAQSTGGEFSKQFDKMKNQAQSLKTVFASVFGIAGISGIVILLGNKLREHVINTLAEARKKVDELGESFVQLSQKGEAAFSGQGGKGLAQYLTSLDRIQRGQFVDTTIARLAEAQRKFASIVNSLRGVGSREGLQALASGARGGIGDRLPAKEALAVAGEIQRLKQVLAETERYISGFDAAEKRAREIAVDMAKTTASIIQGFGNMFMAGAGVSGISSARGKGGRGGGDGFISEFGGSPSYNISSFFPSPEDSFIMEFSGRPEARGFPSPEDDSEQVKQRMEVAQQWHDFKMDLRLQEFQLESDLHAQDMQMNEERKAAAISFLDVSADVISQLIRGEQVRVGAVVQAGAQIISSQLLQNASILKGKALLEAKMAASYAAAAAASALNPVVSAQFAAAAAGHGAAATSLGASAAASFALGTAFRIGGQIAGAVADRAQFGGAGGGGGSSFNRGLGGGGYSRLSSGGFGGGPIRDTPVQNFTFVLQGHVIGQNDWVQNYLIPSIRKGIKDNVGLSVRGAYS